ncbi:helix-turn-helix domain-containing protein [Nocardia niigatensis]
MTTSIGHMNTAASALDPLAELRCTATVSVSRAAELLGVSRGYAYEMAKDGRLPVINLGPSRVRVRSAALLHMITDTDA